PERRVELSVPIHVLRDTCDIVQQRYTGQGFGFGSLFFVVLLLANIRGIVLSARWLKTAADAIPRLNATLGDRPSDSLPMFLWPKTKYLLYVLATVEIGILLTSLSEWLRAPVFLFVHS